MLCLPECSLSGELHLSRVISFHFSHSVIKVSSWKVSVHRIKNALFTHCKSANEICKHGAVVSDSVVDGLDSSYLETCVSKQDNRKTG